MLNLAAAQGMKQCGPFRLQYSSHFSFKNYSIVIKDSVSPQIQINTTADKIKTAWILGKQPRISETSLSQTRSASSVGHRNPFTNKASVHCRSQAPHLFLTSNAETIYQPQTLVKRIPTFVTPSNIDLPLTINTEIRIIILMFCTFIQHNTRSSSTLNCFYIHNCISSLLF